MLRVGSQGSEIDISVVTSGANGDVAGVAHGEELIAYANAAVARSADLREKRAAVQKAMGDAQVVDAAAVIANFQRMVRIADGTGIPIESQLDVISADIRHEIGIDQLATAAGRGKNGRLRRLAAPLFRRAAVRVLRSRSR